MAVLYKYDIQVIDAAETKAREDMIWELGRGGWEIITILPGDYKKGDPGATKLTVFMKREATHDIDF